jgi:hypothetical protein
MSLSEMTPPYIPPPAVDKTGGKGPFIIQFYLVQGVGFRCPAYCDQAGQWRDAITNEELPGEIHILA